MAGDPLFLCAFALYLSDPSFRDFMVLLRFRAVRPRPAEWAVCDATIPDISRGCVQVRDTDT
jgi:hypothetical protein